MQAHFFRGSFFFYYLFLLEVHGVKLRSCENVTFNEVLAQPKEIRDLEMIHGRGEGQDSPVQMMCLFWVRFCLRELCLAVTCVAPPYSTLQHAEWPRRCG